MCHASTLDCTSYWVFELPLFSSKSDGAAGITQHILTQVHHSYMGHSAITTCAMQLLLSMYRSEEAAGVAQDKAAELQQRLDGLAAENRVLAEGSKTMRQECNEAWVSMEPCSVACYFSCSQL